MPHSSTLWVSPAAARTLAPLNDFVPASGVHAVLLSNRSVIISSYLAVRACFPHPLFLLSCVDHPVRESGSDSIQNKQSWLPAQFSPICTRLPGEYFSGALW
ncbi:hypothetical protein VTN49DRAFT_3282 [Thermomyces lanuginosus]|uniref:uncharacterized protein n=1 Tax=Thermomyces lanuginosus TaxID=5541 RepID=UPI00374385FE